ncbi:hypothetical protein TWF730_007087 [Orbilia blumenaviensis]|uniref:F-box domain-containing protein n=1 Tax=Orbilia blumenaviensis TaxID=1796055 RepID=A0AAV9VG82_9PEZI
MEETLKGEAVGESQSQGMGNTNPARDAMPCELWAMIDSYLSHEDVKAFSASSKLHRARLAPYLFRHIRLSEASIEGFTNGNLKDLRHRVREVTFQGLKETPSFAETFRLCRIYCTSVGIFSSLTGVTIPFVASSNYEGTISRALVRKLSVHPFYKTMRILRLEGTCIDPMNAAWEQSDEELVAEGSEFLESIGDTSTDEEIYFPTTLEVASAYSFHFLRIELSSAENMLSFHYPCMFYSSSAEILRSLTLRMREDFTLPDGDRRLRFPKLEFLHLILERGVNDSLFITMSEVCPAVQDLVFEGARASTDRPNLYGGLPVHYPSIRKFKKLRTARVPWPADPAVWFRRAPKIRTEVELRHNVKYWTHDGTNEIFLPDLCHVDFVLGYEPVDDFFYYNDIILIPTGMNMEVLAVTRKDRGSWKSKLRFEPGNRRDNDLFKNREVPPYLSFREQSD